MTGLVIIPGSFVAACDRVRDYLPFVLIEECDSFSSYDSEYASGHSVSIEWLGRTVSFDWCRREDRRISPHPALPANRTPNSVRDIAVAAGKIVLTAIPLAAIGLAAAVEAVAKRLRS